LFKNTSLKVLNSILKKPILDCVDVIENFEPKSMYKSMDLYKKYALMVEKMGQ